MIDGAGVEELGPSRGANGAGTRRDSAALRSAGALHHWFTPPRFLAVFAGTAIVVILGTKDPAAAGLVLVGTLTVGHVLHHRSPGVARSAVVSLFIGGSVVALAVALATPMYRSEPTPVVVRQDPGAAFHRPGMATGPTEFEVLGFVASDYDDSPTGVQRAAPVLSTLAATGIVLSRSPGSVDVVDRAGDALVRAHLAGSAALAVVSNFDGTGFNADRAVRMLLSPDSRRRFVSAVAKEITRRGWDGVVLDLEGLPSPVRDAYPVLVGALSDALEDRRVMVAVPASPSGGDARLAGYDLAALAAAADGVVWMAYDEHEPESAPGPVAGLPWVRQTLAVARASVPAQKLLLGIPGYGYGWSPFGQAEELTVAQARKAGNHPGSEMTWDETEQEWRLRLADGREVWFSDARSFGVRARLAHNEGLAGVALWRVGAEDPASWAQLPVTPKRHRVTVPDRGSAMVRATGLVALTFDDGPDPTWTPRILEVLEAKQVPATFFVIGSQVQRHPGLVRRMMRNGHVVGNHSQSHMDLSRTSPVRAKLDLMRAGMVIEGITGARPRLFRAPYGHGETTSRRIGANQLAVGLGLHPLDWDNDSGDWQAPGSEAIVRRVLDQATERTVVLLHDGGGNRSQTVAALPHIIDRLEAGGYVFTTADALDAAIGSPYEGRQGLLSRARGLAVIATYRLEMALRRVGMILLVVLALLSLLRLVVSAPLALAHGWSARHRRVGGAEEVSFSIIVPAHNEARVIAKCLAAIGQLRWDRFEVIVVDDGSSDGTHAVASRFGHRVIRQPRSGKAAALNTGLTATTGDVVVVLDADTVLTPGFLAAIAPHFADPGVGAVAGNVKVGNRRCLLPRLQALEYIVSLNLDRRAQAQVNLISVVPGAAGAFRRHVLHQVDGYPGDTLVEDADLTVTVLLAGWTVRYEPGAVAWTEAPETVRAVIDQRRRWSYGTIQVIAKHSQALLHPAARRVGIAGLPWTLVSQVVLPIGGPVLDVYLLYLVLTGRGTAATVILVFAFYLDLLVMAGAVLADGEDVRLLVWAPFLRLVWRPLQLFAAFSSARRWIAGEREAWKQIERYNSVQLKARRRQEPGVGYLPLVTEGDRL